MLFDQARRRLRLVVEQLGLGQSDRGLAVGAVPVVGLGERQGRGGLRRRAQVVVERMAGDRLGEALRPLRVGGLGAGEELARRQRAPGLGLDRAQSVELLRRAGPAHDGLVDRLRRGRVAVQGGDFRQVFFVQPVAGQPLVGQGEQRARLVQTAPFEFDQAPL